MKLMPCGELEWQELQSKDQAPFCRAGGLVRLADNEGFNSLQTFHLALSLKEPFGLYRR